MTTHRHNVPVTAVPRTIEDLRGHLPPRLVRRAIRQAEFMGLRLDGIESDRTRSDLETAFLALFHRHGLERLVVEADTWTYHRGSVAFEDDHARELDLRAAGFTVLRFSDRQLEEEPGRVVADVARALSQED